MVPYSRILRCAFESQNVCKDIHSDIFYTPKKTPLVCWSDGLDTFHLPSLIFFFVIFCSFISPPSAAQSRLSLIFLSISLHSCFHISIVSRRHPTSPPVVRMDTMSKDERLIDDDRIVLKLPTQMCPTKRCMPYGIAEPIGA